MKKSAPLASAGEFESRIVTVGGRRVILDADLAAIYGVSTKRLNEQVKRNARRFPVDFAFRLNRREAVEVKSGELEVLEGEAHAANRSQFATGLAKHRDPRTPPLVFTEYGAVMAANVLNSPQAVRMSVWVVRAFFRMRMLLGIADDRSAELRRIETQLGARLDGHESAIVDVMRRLIDLLDPPPGEEVAEKELGFHVNMKNDPARGQG